jgi:hypothetical protein
LRVADWRNKVNGEGSASWSRREIQLDCIIAATINHSCLLAQNQITANFDPVIEIQTKWVKRTTTHKVV